MVTISQGNVVWDGGKLTVVAGAGRFVHMPLFPPLFEGQARRDAAWLPQNFPYGETPVQREQSGGAASSDEL